MASKSTKSAKIQVFTDIKELLTFSGAAAKGGRKVREEDLDLIEDAAIVVDSGKFRWVGSRQKLPSEFKASKVKKTSLKGQTVMPAFVECHTHLVFAGSRSHEFEMRQNGSTYQEISKKGGGILSTVKATRASRALDLQSLAQRRVNEFLKQGVTTIEIKSGYGLNDETEMKMLSVVKNLKGARIVGTYLGPHSLGPEFSNYEEMIQSITESGLPKIAKNKLARRADIYVDSGFFSVQQAREYFKKASALGMDLVIHAEQLSRTGAGQLAIELGARSADHLVEVNDQDIANLSRSEITCVLLPGADYYLKMKYPPARKLIDQGARVALATDFNPGTCPTQDLGFIGLLARVEMKMTLPEVLSAYTVGAAHALGLQNELGSIEVGKSADFVSWSGAWSDLFYSVGGLRPQSVFKMGSPCKT